MKTTTLFRRHLLALATLAALLFAASTASAQTYYYVFVNGTDNYLYNNNGSLGTTTTFSPSCIWIASGQLGGTSRTLRSYSDNTKYIQNANPVTLGGSGTNFRCDSDSLLYMYASRTTYYVSRTSATSIARSGSNNFTAHRVTIDEETGRFLFSSNPGYVICYGGNKYLGGTSTTALDAFAPTTCIWTGNSGGTFYNGSRYLRYNSGLQLSTTSSNASTWNIGGTENSTIGQYIYNGNNSSRYRICYDNGSFTSTRNNTTNSTILFSVTCTVYTSSETVPTISGPDVIADGGTTNYSKTNAAYIAGYYDYVFYNNNHHYFESDNSTSRTGVPSPASFTYSWFLSSVNPETNNNWQSRPIDPDKASINPTTGAITYNSPFDQETTAYIVLTASSSEKTYVVSKQVTFKRGIFVTTDPTHPFLYVIQGAYSPSNKYASDKQTSDNYIPLDGGNFATATSDASAFNNTLQAEYGWYFTDPHEENGRTYYRIFNYATGHYLYLDNTENGQLVEYRTTLPAEGNKNRFAVEEYQSGFAIIPYAASGTPRINAEGASMAVHNGDANTSVWNIVPVDLYKLKDIVPAQVSFSTPSVSIDPTSASTSLGGSSQFSVFANTVTMTVTRPSYQVVHYSKDNTDYYRYATNGTVGDIESSMVIRDAAPEESSTAWTAYNRYINAPTKYFWQLASHAPSDNSAAVALLSIGSRTADVDTLTTSLNNVSVWQRLAHTLNTPITTSLAAQAIYRYTDHFGVANTYQAPAVYASISIPPFPERVTPDNDEGTYTVYRHQNYYGGYLRSAMVPDDGAGIITDNANIDFAEFYWYLIPCGDHVHVVNLFTRQFLYWNSDNSVVLKSTTDADIRAISDPDEQAHYDWNSKIMYKAGDNENTYLRIYPKNSSIHGLCLAPADADHSDNLRLIDIAAIRENPASNDSLFSFWKLTSAQVNFIAPSLSDVAIVGDPVLTATGNYPYAATGQIIPRHYAFRNNNYYVAATNPDGTSRQWARGSYPAQPRNFNTDDESQLSWTLSPAVSGVVFSSSDNSASIAYNNLVSDHEESTLQVTSLRYDGVTFTDPASLNVTFGGNADPTAIVASPAEFSVGAGLDFNLSYTITPSYAYNYVKARIITGNGWITVPTEASTNGTITIHGVARGTATLVLEAYAKDQSNLKATSATVTVHVLTPSTTPEFVDGTTEVRLFRENKLRITNESASTSNKDSIYFFTGSEVPIDFSGLDHVVAGDELDISAYPNGTILRAVAWIDGSAASAVAEYTIYRYDLPYLTPSTRENMIRFHNPNFTSDATTKLFFSINGTAPVWVEDPQPYVHYLPGEFNQQAYGDYFFRNTSSNLRVIGNNKYPSEVSHNLLSRYSKPILENFQPATDETNGSATFVSDFGSCIAVNYNIYASDGTTLVNPNPFDPTTYNFSVSSGSSSSLFAARTFKAIAFDCAITSAPDDYEPVTFNSAVATFDNSASNYWAFCHQADGNKFYLSADPETKTLRTINQFDNTCLWYHDANHRLYVSLGGVKYYLTFNAGALGLSTSAPSNIDWDQSGNTMIALRYEPSLQGYASSTLAYTSDNRWICGAEGNTVVRFDVFSETLPNETRTELDQFNLTPLLSDNAGKQAEHYTTSSHKWIAFDTPGESFSFNLKPDLTTSIHNYYACDHYYFEDASHEIHQYFFFNNICYPVRADMPHSSRSGRSSSEDYVTFHWNISGDAAEYFSLAKTATWEDFTSHYTVSRSDDPVDHPLEAQLVVTAVYDHDGVHKEVSTPAISLFAETKASAIADKNNRPVTAGEERYYRLVNYYDPATLMHMNTEGNDNGRTNYMSLSNQITSGQILYVRQFTSDNKTYYSLYSPRYNHSLAWNKDTASTDYISPYYLDVPKSDNDTQFIVTPYRDDVNGCYVTFHPRTLIEDHPYATYTPAPMVGATGDNVLLRQYNSEGSWNQQLLGLYNHASLETDPSYFAKTRWQLATPSFVLPTISMDPEGFVSFVDIAADQIGLQYTIQYRINGSSDWTNYEAAHKPILFEGDVIVARTIPTPYGNADYFNPSPETEPFTARKVVTPTLTRSGNDVVLESPTATGDVPVEATIYYNLNSTTDPSNDGSSITFTAPSDNLSAGYNPFKAIAYAPNCLKSDVLNVNYQAQLELSLSAEGSTVTMSVSNEGISLGSDYQIRYTVDGSVPSLSSTLYETPVPFSQYALVRAKAFSLNTGFTDSDIKQLRINGAYYTLTCIVDGDTNFLLHSDDNHIFNSNVPGFSAAWNGPVPGNADINGNYFTGYWDNFYLNIVEGNLTTTTTTTTTKWIYNDEFHTLREAAAPNRYVVFDKSNDSWTLATTPNADQITAVCFPTIYRDHPYQVEVDAQALALNFYRIQRHDWVDNLDKGEYASMKTRYDMNGNWTSLIGGDTADFVASISLKLDSTITPAHMDAYIFNTYADSASYDYEDPAQWWHYFEETNKCYNKPEAFVIQRRDTVSRADANTHFNWSHSGDTYFTYLSPLGIHGDTLRVVRNSTAATSPDFNSTLSVSASYDIAGADPVNFSLQTGHLYAESAVEYTTPGNFTIRNFKDQEQYLAVIPDSLIGIWSGLPEVYVSGRPRIAFSPNYDLNAVWNLKSCRNYTNNHRILHINNAAFTKDSVFWLTNQPNHASSDTCIYLWDPTSPQEFNWRVKYGSTALHDTSIFFEFMFRRYNNGPDSYYYTISLYDYDRRMYNNKPLCNDMRAEAYSRLSLMSSAYRVYSEEYISRNPNCYLHRIHPVWTYSNWGEGHAADGAESFKASRWLVESPQVLQPVVAMDPSGNVSISNPSASVNTGLSGTMIHYYTTDGSTPTTSSSTYDPDHKPLLTLGQTLKVFTYVDGLSSPVTVFTPTQSERPLLSMDEATHLLYISYSDGDSVITSLNNGAPSWNSTGPSFAYYDGEPLFMSQSDIIQARAFRHNYFQSEMVEYHFDQTLQVVINYTYADETTEPKTPPIISLTTTNGQGTDPVTGFYSTYWTTDPAADLVNINPNNLPENIHPYDGSNITGTSIFPQGQVTYFRAVAKPSGEALFYTASDIVSKQVAWGYSSDNTLTEGTGDLENPYLISNVGDLITVALNPTYRSGKYYKVVNDIDATGIEVPSIAAIGGSDNFRGYFDGDFHTIKGLTHPLFDVVDGARIYNVNIDNSHIVTTNADGHCGAIVNVLGDDEKTGVVFNCNILNSDGTATVTGSNGHYTGGVVGFVKDNAKVINCSNFASVSVGGYVGGIAGYLESKSTATTMKTLAYCCMNYGDVSGTNVGPTVGHNAASNLGSDGVNLYCYFLPTVQLSGTLVNDGTLAAEEKYLTRFEFYKNILNSFTEICHYFITGSFAEMSDGFNAGKWALDKSIAPYPIVKAPIVKADHTFYPSSINPDYESADRDNALPYQGKRLGRLAVTMNRGSYGSGESSANASISITDMDTLNYDFNYGKIQLPYYQDYFGYDHTQYTGNANRDYIVTGWEITSVTGGTAGSYTTNGTNAYNFADRNCTAKDLYSNTGRVYAEGGYYNVPEGVTAITITAHWATAVYLSDASYDVKYNAQYATASASNLGGNSRPTTYHGKNVNTSLNDAFADLPTGSSVYDYAIVLVGNYHSKSDNWNSTNASGKAFTLMSVDNNNDHEPDYCLYLSHGENRPTTRPVRFTNLIMPALGRAAKPNNEQTGLGGPAIPHTAGHFELTETALARFTEFEYDPTDRAANTPLILNGGIYEQFVTENGATSNRVSYIQVGGHAYFYYFAQGSHSNSAHNVTIHPVSVLGGEYKEFYLSSYYHPSETMTGNGLMYANGGKFVKFASGAQSQIRGDVIVKADHIIAHEFYGGGINSQKPVTGNINITIDHSLVDIYGGGPQFGNMAAGKTVTTNATGTTFGTYYGAGFGGSSLQKTKLTETAGATPTAAQNHLSTQFTNNYTVGGVSNSAVLVDYSYEFFAYAGEKSYGQVARPYLYYASLSKAVTHDVNNNLTDCVVNNNFFGAGFVGSTEGNVTSVLDNTIVHGNAFGAGNSATIPTCTVYEKPTSLNMPTYDANWLLYSDPDAIHTRGIVCQWTHVDNLTAPAADLTNQTINTNVSLDGFGKVTGNIGFTIKGNSVINGHVFGGGDASEVKGDIDLKVLGNTHVYGHVFGGGNTAKVAGSINVQIGEK